jgi:hypothetical protein
MANAQACVKYMLVNGVGNTIVCHDVPSDRDQPIDSTVVTRAATHSVVAHRDTKRCAPRTPMADTR